MRNRVSLPALLASLVIFLALASRLPEPFRYGLINDEQHHLESWRNRYRTDDVYTVFLERLRATNKLRGPKLALVERIYHSSPIVQRALICLVDPQPPLFPLLAELVEAATHSSLIAIRIPSLLASLLAIYLMFRIGRHLDRVLSPGRRAGLSLWLPALLTIGFLPITMSGFARPYALVQCALLATTYAFLRQERTPDASPRNFLLLALLTQGLQWMAWSLTGPLVLLDLYLRHRAGVPARRLLRQSWWYFVVSAVVLCEMFVQLLNPTISGQGGARAPAVLWYHFSLASPFAQLATFGPGWLHVAGALFAVLILAGLAALLVTMRRKTATPTAADGAPAPRPTVDPAPLALVATTLLGLFAAAFIGSREPFWMTYGLPSLITAGVGATLLLRSPRGSQWGLLVLLALFTPVILAKPADPYDYFYPNDTPYAPVAQTLRDNLKPGDRWLSTPYNLGNCLYGYGPLPEPIFPQSNEQLTQFLRDRDPATSLYVLTMREKLPLIAQFDTPDRQWNFRNRVVLLRLPPRPSSAPAAPSTSPTPSPHAPATFPLPLRSTPR